MNFLSRLWLSTALLFEPVQYFFNGNFWNVFIKRFGVFNEDKVVDLACGTGEINKYIKPKKYLGVDFNKFYINYAQKKFSSRYVDFRVGDITSFKISDKYDMALLISAAHHLNDKQILKICKNLEQNKIKHFLIIDAIPEGWFSKILKWLDAKLGGGEYFRNLSEIEQLITQKYKVKKKGFFLADKSFYSYYFLYIAIF